ncbi:unnamed protein product, partial [Iphiclides podalirius]
MISSSRCLRANTMFTEQRRLTRGAGIPDTRGMTHLRRRCIFERATVAARASAQPSRLVAYATASKYTRRHSVRELLLLRKRIDSCSMSFVKRFRSAPFVVEP